MSLNILALLTAFVILINGITIRFIMSDFIKIFSKLGAELPSTTQYLLWSYNFWIYLLIIPIIVFIFSLIKKEISKNVTRIFSASLIFLIIFFLCMVPVIYLGAFSPISDLLSAKMMGR
jgi:type II secretory pathway component PulF